MSGPVLDLLSLLFDLVKAHVHTLMGVPKCKLLSETVTRQIRTTADVKSTRLL